MSFSGQPTRELSNRVVQLEPCPLCGSRDNVKRYDDGHAKCFGINRTTGGRCEFFDPPGATPGEAAITWTEVREQGLVIGEVLPIPSRGITGVTCGRYGYAVGKDYSGTPVQIAPYYSTAGRLVAQKLRYKDKNFSWTGHSKEATLFGQHLQPRGKRLFVTEGEVDALSLSQALDHKWPVVSIRNGAPNAKTDLVEQLEYLKNFEEVVLVLDSDSAGRAAAEACGAALITTVPVRIVTLPLKDANDMLRAGRVQEMVSACFRAPLYRPKFLISVKDAKDLALREPEIGLPWPWTALTKLTYGRRRGELYALGSGVGCGKTDTFHTWEAFDLHELKVPIAAFHLEEPPGETLQRLGAKVHGVPFFLPGKGDRSLLSATLDDWDSRGVLHLAGQFGKTDKSAVMDAIRYLYHVHGVYHVYLDHLTALAAHAEDERRYLDGLMEEFASLTQELGLIFHFVSHLATPAQGNKPHEEGGRVKANQFRGSRAIMQWANYMFGQERNTQAKEDFVKHTSVFRVLKARYAGEANGGVFLLKYDGETSLLHEVTDKKEADRYWKEVEGTEDGDF